MRRGERERPIKQRVDCLLLVGALYENKPRPRSAQQRSWPGPIRLQNTDQQKTVNSSYTHSDSFTAGCPLALSFALSAANPLVLSALHFAITSPLATLAFVHAES